MRVGFVYSEMEALGIQYLSSYLKKHGHETRLFFDPQLFMDSASRSPFLSKILDYKKVLYRQIDEFKPDILGFSVLSTNYQWACQIAQDIKQHSKVPIVFGGIHPTLDPDAVLGEECVDFIVVGEGEEALLELTENIYHPTKKFGIRNVYSKNNGSFIKNPLRPLVANLDTLPFPDKEMFFSIMPYSSRNYMIITSRGCPHACSFCCNDPLRKTYGSGQRFLRRRSPENVIAELEWAKKTYSTRYVFFDDSTFTYDKKWLGKFSQLYKKNIGLACFCWVHPSEINEETVDFLKEMNCRAVEMGVESLNPEIRKKWLNRHYTNEQIEHALQLFKRNKIFCITDNIIGLPEETFSDLEFMVEFYNRTRPGKIYVFELRPFPNTKLANLKKAEQPDNKKRRGLLPFTVYTYQNSQYKKIVLLMLAIYFFPKKVISFLLKKRVYKFFPPFYDYNMLYNLLEIVPFFINCLTFPRYWFPVRRARHRYFFFAKELVVNFFKGNR